MTIIEFLEARIAEDEALANAAIAKQAPDEWDNETRTLNLWPEDIAFWDRQTPYRVLAECAAKRAIIKIAADQIRLGREAGGWQNWEDMANQTLHTLAAVYSSHDDYDSGWAL